MIEKLSETLTRITNDVSNLNNGKALRNDAEIK
jgi:hypothetical protein